MRQKMRIIVAALVLIPFLIIAGCASSDESYSKHYEDYYHGIGTKQLLDLKPLYTTVETVDIRMPGGNQYYKIKIICGSGFEHYSFISSATNYLGMAPSCPTGKGMVEGKMLRSYRVIGCYNQLYTYEFQIDREALEYYRDTQSPLLIQGAGGSFRYAEVKDCIIDSILTREDQEYLKWDDSNVEKQKQLADNFATQILISANKDDYNGTTLFSTGESYTPDPNVTYDLKCERSSDACHYVLIVYISKITGAEIFTVAKDIKGFNFRMNYALEQRKDSDANSYLVGRIIIPLNDDYIKECSINGINMKIYGNQSDVFVTIPAWIIQGMRQGVRN